MQKWKQWRLGAAGVFLALALLFLPQQVLAETAANSFELAFVKMGEQENNTVYQLYVRQTEKITGNLADWGLRTMSMYIQLDGGSYVDGVLIDGASGVYQDTIGMTEHQGTALLHITHSSHLMDPWAAPGDGFAPVATIITSGDCTFSLGEGPEANVITTSGSQDSANFSLIEMPPQVKVENISGDGNSTQVELSVPVPFSGQVICAAYDENGRMLAVAGKAVTMPSIADWTLGEELNPAQRFSLTLNCTYSQVKEIRLFVVGDMVAVSPLRDKQIYQ